MGNAKPYPAIELDRGNVAKVERVTYWTIAYDDERGVRHHPEPYEKRVIRLRHKLDIEPGHIYRIGNIKADEGKTEPTWFYDEDGLTIREC